MSVIEKTPEISYFKPYYLKSTPRQKSEVFDEIRSHHNLSDRLVEWGADTLKLDYDQQIEITRVAAIAIERGTFVFHVGIEGSIAASTILTHCPSNPVLWTILQIISLPFLIVSFILGPIQIVTESIQCSSGFELLRSIDPEVHPLEIQLKQIKKHYFSLEPKETEKIKTFVEKHLKEAPTVKKRELFDKIATKALKLKGAALGRRVSYGLAKEVALELNGVLKEFSSSDPKVREKAVVKGKVLMESITTQAKRRIALHLLVITTIILPLILLSMALVSPPSLLLIALLDGIAIGGAIAGFFYDTIVFSKGGGAFKEELAEQIIAYENRSVETRPSLQGALLA